MTLRMPPPTMTTSTVIDTSNPPTQVGVSSKICRARPAPCSWGNTYSQPIRTTSALAINLTFDDRSRASQKSGRVYAPERRNGAATRASRSTYPTAYPTGNQTASAPPAMIRPATPKKEAADRYSPEIAEAFHHAGTERDAT